MSAEARPEPPSAGATQSLIEISGFGVDGGEARRPLAHIKPDNDLRAAGAQRAQMGHEPGAAPVKVDVEAGVAPRRHPEINQGGKIGLGEIP